MERTWKSIVVPLACAFVAVFGPGVVAVACLAGQVAAGVLPFALVMSPTTEPTISVVRFLGVGGIDALWLLPAAGLGFFALVAWIAIRTAHWPQARWWLFLLIPTTGTNAWFAAQTVLGNR